MSVLAFLYGTPVGRACLKLLTAPPLSRAAGKFLDTPASKCLIAPFVKRAKIDLSEYECDSFASFNDCFTRRVKPGRRPVDTDPSALIAPCDGLLSVYELRGDTVLPVKQSEYTVSSLLAGDPASRLFEDGTALIFRLCVDNYHRYCYVDSGVKGENIHIPGVLHTVRPVALERVPVFAQNSREYTLIRSENLGRILQMEVGAMLVGRIQNHHGPGPVKRGQEKGMFLYGGSTIIVLLQKNAAAPDPQYLENTRLGLETPVRLGQRIGTALRLI